MWSGLLSTSIFRSLKIEILENSLWGEDFQKILPYQLQCVHKKKNGVFEDERPQMVLCVLLTLYSSEIFRKKGCS